MDVIVRMYHVSCMDLIRAHYHDIGSCFLETGSPKIVGDFLSRCQSTTTCDLWTRVATMCDALNSALEEIDSATGRTSLWHQGILVHGQRGCSAAQ